MISEKAPSLFEDKLFTIVDDENNKPISTLKEKKETAFRLSDYMGQDYRFFARYRIESIEAVFIDKAGNYLPKQSKQTETEETQVQIDFPNVFNDRNTRRQNHIFYTNQKSNCKSYYRYKQKSKHAKQYTDALFISS